MSRTIRWTIGLVIVASAVIFGITCLILVRYGSLETRPWQTIGLSVGAVGGLGGFILCIVESAQVLNQDEHAANDAVPAQGREEINA